MISVTTRRDDDVLQEQKALMLAAPEKMKRFAGLQARGATAQRMIGELSYNPPRYTGKRDWQSDKQRRYVMMIQKGKPYQRTGRRLRGWRCVVENGALVVVNTERGIRFLQGDDMQRMHIKTGYRAAAPIIVRYEIIFQDEFIDYWHEVTGAK
jgi:hypothetical protein